MQEQLATRKRLLRDATSSWYEKLIAPNATLSAVLSAQHMVEGTDTDALQQPADMAETASSRATRNNDGSASPEHHAVTAQKAEAPKTQPGTTDAESTDSGKEPTTEAQRSVMQLLKPALRKHGSLARGVWVPRRKVYDYDWENGKETHHLERQKLCLAIPTLWPAEHQPAHAAVSMPCEAAAKESLSAVYKVCQGEDLHAWSRLGFTPLGLAAFLGRRQLVQMLIESGASLSAGMLLSTARQFVPHQSTSGWAHHEVLTPLSAAALGAAASAKHPSVLPASQTYTKPGSATDLDTNAAGVDFAGTLQYLLRAMTEAGTAKGTPAAQKDSQEPEQPSVITADVFRPLHSALQRGWEPELKCILPLYTSMLSTTCPGFSGWQPLHVAAQGPALSVRLLLDLGANKDAVGSELNYTPLMVAVARGNAEVCQLLISSGAALEAVPGTGTPGPLHLAAREGYDDILSQLLKAGANQDARDGSGMTPLMAACAAARTSSVTTLLGHKGSKPDESLSDMHGYTALHHAVLAASEAGGDTLARELVVPLIKSHTGDLRDKQGRTALHLLAMQRCGSIELVQILIHKGGCLVDAKDGWGHTSLDLAVAAGSNEMVQELSAHSKQHTGPTGVAPAKANSTDIPPAMQQAFDAASRGNLDAILSAIQAAKENNLNLDQPNDRQDCLVHVLCARGTAHRQDTQESSRENKLRLAALKAAVQAGANINARNGVGQTALHVATYHASPSAQNRPVPTVELLLELRADPNAACFNGGTALMLLAASGETAAMRKLISAGADVNACTTNGFTAAMQAARNGHLDALKLLVEHKANLEAFASINTKSGTQLSSSASWATEAQRQPAVHSSSSGRLVGKGGDLWQGPPGTPSASPDTAGQQDQLPQNRETVLTLAIRRDHADVITWLLNKRLFNLREKGQLTEPHPLVLAVSKGCLGATRAMLQYATASNTKRQEASLKEQQEAAAASASATDIQGKAPVEGEQQPPAGSQGKKAGSKTRPAKRVVLLPAANFCNYQGMSMLMMAARCSAHSMVQLLLEFGADPNFQDSMGYTALHMAVLARSSQVSFCACSHVLKRSCCADSFRHVR
jgi:ankyrin repeat protein